MARSRPPRQYQKAISRRAQVHHSRGPSELSSSETLLVDDAGPGLVALVLSDERPFELGDLGDDGGFDPPDVSPLGRGLVLSDEHLFELGELGDDGGSGPPDVSPFGRGRELAIGPLRRQGSKFQFQVSF